MDEEGMTPLMMAATTNSGQDVVLALLEAGADPNAGDEDGWTALAYTLAFNDNPAIVRALLAGGADVFAADYDGLNVLEIAAIGGAQLETLENLVTGGLDFNEADPETGYTPLMLAVIFGGNPDSVASLGAAGADGSLLNVAGDSVYDLALKVEEYSELDPDPALLGRLGAAAKQWRGTERREGRAASRGFLICSRFLVKTGANSVSGEGFAVGRANRQERGFPQGGCARDWRLGLLCFVSFSVVFNPGAFGEGFGPVL